MAEFATIARPYAEALFRVAKSGDLSAWSGLVSEMAQVAAHPDVQALSHNPNVSDKQIADTFLALLKSPVNDEAKNLVGMLVENGRVSLLPEIGAQFHVLKNAQEGAADAGAAAVMPLGSPIGSNRGVKTRELVRIMVKELKVPVIVDAGIGKPSDACECMELGCAAVLINTAVAISKDPVNTAKAFNLAVCAGRMAYLTGIPQEGDIAKPSSPLTGFLGCR